MIPTSIDGTDITGATIDGTDVTEITVDGQTVFTAANLPVAFSDMIAWYPFESNITDGDEYSDATALFSGAGDSTAYDLTDDGAIFESSEGVTDINQGSDSGAFENVNGGEYLTTSVPIGLPITITFWYYRTGGKFAIGSFDSGDWFYYQAQNGNWLANNSSATSAGSSATNVWAHTAWSVDSSGNVLVVHDRDNTATGTISDLSDEDVQILNVGDGRSDNDMRGYIDDVRFYDTNLSHSQIKDIYDNTNPN